MVYIYILECLKYKYYIGKTINPKFRLQDHFEQKGCNWTSKYRPIKVLDIFKGDNYDEDKYTLMYMERYGIENVRGGSFVQIVLTQEQVKQINLQLNMANDRCIKCGKRDHFEKDCKKIVCYRCGRNNHCANKCYAKKHVKGYYLC